MIDELRTWMQQKGWSRDKWLSSNLHSTDTELLYQPKISSHTVCLFCKPISCFWWIKVTYLWLERAWQTSANWNYPLWSFYERFYGILGVTISGLYKLIVWTTSNLCLVLACASLSFWFLLERPHVGLRNICCAVLEHFSPIPVGWGLNRVCWNVSGVSKAQ